MFFSQFLELNRGGGGVAHSKQVLFQSDLSSLADAPEGQDPGRDTEALSRDLAHFTQLQHFLDPAL